MGVSRKQLLFNVAAASDPSWFTALSDLQVTRRGSSAGVDAIRPGGVGSATFDDIMTSWCGGAFDDTNDIWYTGPGAGHTNYGGAEVYGYRVITETWFQAYTPSSAGTGGDGFKSDGSPLATHTYDELVFVGGEMWLGAMGSVDGSSGVGSNRGWVWDADSSDLPSSGTRGWTDLGLNTLDGSNDTGAVAYDSLTNKVYYCKRFTGGSAKQIASWNRSTKVRTEHSVSSAVNFGGSGGDMTACCIQSGADSALLGIGDSNVRAINLQNLLAGTTAWQAPTFTGTQPGTGKCRVHYVAETNQLVTWEIGTNNLLVATVPANIFTGTYNWRRIALSGVTITAASANGTFGRFQVFRMPTGRLAFFLVNSTTEQVHIGKLPVAAM